MRINGKFKNVVNIFPLCIYLALGGVCGLLMPSYIDKTLKGSVSLFSYFAVLLIMVGIMYLAIIVQRIIHETGHLIFGLISRYKFISFRIFNVMIIKIDGKYKIKFITLSGNFGQCVMMPPDFKNGTVPYALYNLGGSVLNFVSAALFGCLYFIFRDIMKLPIILIILSLCGMAIGLINIIPLRFSEVPNDATVFFALYSSDKALETFYIHNLINAELLKGKRLKDMPSKWFNMPDNKELMNTVLSQSAYFYSKRLIDEHEFSKAEIIIDKLLDNDNALSSLHRRLLICDKILCLNIEKISNEKTEKYIDAEQKLFMKKMKNYPSVIRTNYVIENLINKNFINSEILYRKFNKISAQFPYGSEIKSENELFEILKSKQNY